LFRYLRAEASSRFGVGREEILHCGQSQFTDMVGAKPLGLTVAWINRRAVPLDPSVPRPDYVFPDLKSLLLLMEQS
jgi:2-haloacid dehalogenase